MKTIQVSSNFSNSTITYTDKFTSKVCERDNINFKGAQIKSKIFEPVKSSSRRVMDPLETKIAQGFVKLLESKPVEKLINKTNSIKPKIDKQGNPKKFTDKLTSHLIVLGSTLLSAFYVVKTLQNKQLDEDKRKTLAINQGLVYVASTIMAYTFDGWARNKTNPYIDSLITANAHMQPEKLNKMVSGMKLARSIITIDMVYRFIAPVLVTPLANYIGNKLKEKK